MRAMQEIVRNHATERIADDAGEEGERGEERSVLDVEVIVALEERRQPVEIEP